MYSGQPRVKRLRKKPKSFEADILISGGGIAGLSLAAILGHAGINVHIIDNFKSPPLSDVKPNGRTVALMETSLNIIRATGAWDKVAEFGGVLETMQIIDDSRKGHAPLPVEFHACDIGLDQFGFNVPNDILRAALSEEVQKIQSVTMHVPDCLSGYEITGNKVSATLESGNEITAALIIGADGRNSAVREISGINTEEKEYGQSAITCLINHSRSHNNTSTEFHRSSGPLALVPLPGNRSSVVWVNSAEKCDALLSLKKEEFTQTLQDKTNNILGGITLETGPESWPLRSIKAKDIIAPRTALMAEAAHVLSPITAQGLNLSLRDVAALAETIADALRLGLDPGSASVLKKYERRRRTDIGTRVYGVDGMMRIVSNDIEALKELRRAGLKTLDAVPPLKKLAMRTGLAPQVDIGRLARGEVL